MNKKVLLSTIRELETPFYTYDLDVLRKNAGKATQEADKYGFHIHYALKANSNPRILKELVTIGFGADCVSGEEVRAALNAGFTADQIAFAGVGKTDKEIILALEHGIFSLNVESLEELLVIAELAQQAGRIAQIALRINPDVDANTHHYITTGLEENKFGLGLWQLPEVLEIIRREASLNLVGLHFHIGSQITSLEPFRNLCNRINQIQDQIEQMGHRVQHINAGGGLGINYEDPREDGEDFGSFFEIFDQFLDLRVGQKLHFELGRSIVASCGDLISRVIHVKKGLKTNFMILDAGMTELIRPALYQSFHKIENLSNPSQAPQDLYDVVGPVCESSDSFGKALQLPVSKRGDIIAIRSVGAYGESMASQYNLRSLNPSVYFESGVSKSSVRFG